MELEAYQIFGFFPRGVLGNFQEGCFWLFFFFKRVKNVNAAFVFFRGSSRFEQGGALPLNFRYESSLGMNGAEIH